MHAGDASGWLVNGMQGSGVQIPSAPPQSTALSAVDHPRIPAPAQLIRSNRQCACPVTSSSSRSRVAGTGQPQQGHRPVGCWRPLGGHPARADQDDRLVEQIQRIHTDTAGTYGSRRVRISAGAVTSPTCGSLTAS